jgi:hypothetical protein
VWAFSFASFKQAGLLKAPLITRYYLSGAFGDGWQGAVRRSMVAFIDERRKRMAAPLSSDHQRPPYGALRRINQRCLKVIRVWDWSHTETIFGYKAWLRRYNQWPAYLFQADQQEYMTVLYQAGAIP